MRRAAAFSFQSYHNMKSLRERLNARGTHNWIERDNDNYGEYISTRAHAADGFYKIYHDDQSDGYCLTITFSCDRSTFDEEFAELERTALDGILPWIEARDIRERETWD